MHDEAFVLVQGAPGADLCAVAFSARPRNATTLFRESNSQPKRSEESRTESAKAPMETVPKERCHGCTGIGSTLVEWSCGAINGQHARVVFPKEAGASRAWQFGSNWRLPRHHGSYLVRYVRAFCVPLQNISQGFDRCSWNVKIDANSGSRLSGTTSAKTYRR